MKEKMVSQKSIRDILEMKNNDYTRLEPFTNASPIPSSIIVPVYNNRGILRKTLKNISTHPAIEKNPGAFEIIIVNDGSTEDISSVVGEMSFSCKLRYLHYEQNHGRSHARNVGIRNSTKDLLFFLDADVLLPENYFDAIWKIHNSSKNILVVGLAQNVPNHEITNTQATEIFPNIADDFRYHKTFPKGKFDTSEYWLVQETDWFKGFGYGTSIGPWTLPKMAVAHNLSTRRDNAQRVTGFDHRFVGWGYEDAHFGAKLIAIGCYLIPSKETGVIRILDGKKPKFDDRNLNLYEKLIKTESI